MKNWWNAGDGVITRGGGRACSTSTASTTNLTDWPGIEPEHPQRQECIIDKYNTHSFCIAAKFGLNSIDVSTPWITYCTFGLIHSCHCITFIWRVMCYNCDLDHHTYCIWARKLTPVCNTHNTQSEILKCC